VQNLTYGFDPAGNVTLITDNLDPGRNQSFAYDVLDRLSQGVGSYGQVDYTHDALGNRLTKVHDDGPSVISETYSYDPLSSRLDTRADGTDTHTYTTDLNGSITADSTGTSGHGGNQTTLGNAFVYDETGRLKELHVDEVLVASYAYNAAGQRVSKVLDDTGETINYHYGPAGELLAESDDLGAMLRAYVYLGRVPIAQVEAGAPADPNNVIVDNTDPGAVATGPWTPDIQGEGYEGADHAVLAATDHTLPPDTSELPPGGQIIDNIAAGFFTNGPWASRADGADFEGANYLRLDYTAGAETIIDNSDAGFGVTGPWANSTWLAGYYGADYHRLLVNTAVRPGSEIIDNGDAGFGTVGPWTSYANCACFQGVDYLHIPPWGISPDAVYLDNTDPGFTITGTWTSATFWSGYWGTDYLWATPNDVSIDAVVVDNSDPGFSATTTWEWSTECGCYVGTDFDYNFPGGPSSDDFIVDNRDPGVTVIGTWYTDAPGNCCVGTDYQYRFPAGVGAGALYLDNSDPGFAATGDWVIRTDFSGFWGTDYRSSATNDSAGADKVTWTPTLPAADAYRLYARWRVANAGDNADGVTYTVYHDGGPTQVVVDQSTEMGTWVQLGTFHMTPGLNHRVELPDTASAGLEVVADALVFDPLAGADGTMTWPLPVSTAGTYEVHARWNGHSAFAPDAPYTIFHTGGSTTVRMPHNTFGKDWALLGTFQLDPAQNPRVVLSDDASARVSGDAVAINVPGTFETATWTPTIPQSGDYKVLARWGSIACCVEASDAPFTIHHAGGATTVPVNQQIRAGLWTELGTFTMDPGQNHRVELTDLANGLVMADAIAFDPVNGRPTAATWTPTLATADTYRVWARWPGSIWDDRADGVRYTIHHDGGATEVVKNQNAEWGQWVLLGTFPMTPGQNHRVDLIDTTVDPNESRAVIADGMVFDPMGGARNTATWTPALASGAGEYDVYVSWGAYSTYATDAPFRVSHAGGVSEFRVNQKASPLNWRLLGRFQMDPAQGHKVTMSDDADGWVAADAVNFVPAGAAVDTATWSLTIGQRDYYDVAARWPASWPNSAYAYYTLHHDGGASETVHDQNINGGAWMSLGTVVLDPAGNPRVTLDDRAQWDGDPADLAADAVRYVPSVTALRDAIWPVSVSSSGQYRVYARWPARPDNAVDAVYTVHHGAGQTAVAVNQRINGTDWNYLGTFQLDAAGAHKVVLTSSSNAPAVADALYVVADPPPPSGWRRATAKRAPSTR
jgi:hypothetical protein